MVFPDVDVAVNFGFGFLRHWIMKRIGDIIKAAKTGVGLFTQQLY